MPSRSRRQEEDFRSGRFESEVRASELQSPDLWKGRRKMAYCQRCGKAFEEMSKVCPRCDRKDEMGVISPIPDRLLQEAKRKEMEYFRRRGG